MERAEGGQERLDWLVEQEKDCSNCFPFPDVVGKIAPIEHCRYCGGTGKVPRFPMLRRKCPQEDCALGILSEDDLPFGRQGQPHKFCQGRGWTPTDSLEALQAACKQEGLSLAYAPEQDRWLVYNYTVFYEESASILSEAVVLALCKIVEEGL